MVFFLVYWLLASIYGNDIIQHKIFGIDSFIIFLLLGIMEFFVVFFVKRKEPWNIKIKQYKIFKIVGLYVLCSLFYVIISFFNYQKLFDIGVSYSVSYIFRQAYPIAFFPIGILVGFGCLQIYETNNKAKLINIGAIVLWGFLIIVNHFYKADIIPYRMFIMLIAVFILARNKKKLYSIPLIFTILFEIDFFHSSSSMIGVLVPIVFVISVYKWHKFYSKHIISVALVAVVCLFLSFYCFEDYLNEFFHFDLNYLWRYQYWVSEIKLVIRSMFIGLGFGTAYADNSLLDIIVNNKMFVGESGLFLVTQHSSLVNAFYRMGIVGLVIFIILIMYPIKYVCKHYNSISNKNAACLYLFLYLNCLIIICLNPGLESPRFAMGYIFSYSLLMSFCIKEIKSKRFREEKTE